MDQELNPRLDYMNDSGRHFRVVRFYPHFGHGTIEEVLASGLTFEEAQRLAATQGRIPDEDIVIQDQTKQGIEADIAIEPLGGDPMM